MRKRIQKKSMLHQRLCSVMQSLLHVLHYLSSSSAQHQFQENKTPPVKIPPKALQFQELQKVTLKPVFTISIYYSTKELHHVTPLRSLFLFRISYFIFIIAVPLKLTKCPLIHVRCHTCRTGNGFGSPLTPTPKALKFRATLESPFNQSLHVASHHLQLSVISGEVYYSFSSVSLMLIL